MKDRKTYYYLSSGLGTKIYTLRYYEEGYEYQGRTVGAVDSHVKNLAIDYDKAMLKGKEYAEGTGLEFVVNDKLELNNYSQHEKVVFTGDNLCYGNKYLGWSFSMIVNDRYKRYNGEFYENGLDYLDGNFGYPSNPTKDDTACFESVQKIPELVAYRKANQIEKEEEDRKEKEELDRYLNSVHVGDEGEKIEIDVVIDAIFGFETMYGYSVCVKMVDSNGNHLITFTTGKWTKGLRQEDSIKVIGTVKNHNLVDISKFNSSLETDEKVKQTQLTRIKLAS